MQARCVAEMMGSSSCQRTVRGLVKYLLPAGSLALAMTGCANHRQTSARVPPSHVSQTRLIRPVQSVKPSAQTSAALSEVDKQRLFERFEEWQSQQPPE